MNWQQIIFQCVGGLGLFLMGMKFMSEGMQKAAGNRLRKTLNFLTKNRFMAIGVGMTVTAIIQSSSATTVMTVGFVNAALMDLQQAIGVVLGANIGTTITGWIVSLKIVKFALPLIGIGVFLKFFSKSEKWKYAGEIIFGFGILFLGMQTMKAGFAPLRESPDFIAFFTKVDGSGFTSILLGILIGTVTTVIVQSSSATIGITLALASQGLLNYEGAVSLILGENIGTTITAILASIGGNYHAKRAAAAHTLFNVLGVCTILSLFYPFVGLIDHYIPGAADMTVATQAQVEKFKSALGTKPYIEAHIAAAHTTFNITNVIIFTALIPYLAKLCEKLIPEPKKKAVEGVPFSHIDTNVIETPALSIAETEKELMVMADMVTKNSELVDKIINDEKPNISKLCDKVMTNEKTIDEYQKSIVDFLVALSSNSISESHANHIGNYITFSHNLEKFADHLEHVAIVFDKLHRNTLEFSEEAKQHIVDIFAENLTYYNRSLTAFTESIDAQSFMDSTQVINRRVKKIIKQAKISHFDRISKKTCNNRTAIYYIDVLNYLDGMRSQAYNIAEVTSGTKFGG